MKNFARIILAFFMTAGLFGCAMLESNPVPLPVGFCDDAGSRSESHLLKVAGQLVKEGKMTPDEALSSTYWFMIRTTALAQVVEPDAKEFLARWWKEIGVFYLDHVEDGLTWTDLIDFMFSEEKWGARVQLIKIVVDPNYAAYKTILPISAWDNCALKSAHKRAGELFNFGTL